MGAMGQGGARSFCQLLASMEGRLAGIAADIGETLGGSYAQRR